MIVCIVISQISHSRVAHPNTFWYCYCALPLVKCDHMYHSVGSTDDGASYSITLQPAQQASTLVLLELS